MVVDAWIQIPNARFLADDMFASLRRWTGGPSAPDDPVAGALAAMDAAGVTRSLVSAWYGPNGPLITNDEVAVAVAAHPDRFCGVASVDATRPVAAVRELRRAVRELGFVGLRMLPWLWGTPPTDRRFYPLYAECVELDVPFCTQVGHTGPLRRSEPGRPIPYVDEIALDFPELTIVAGHIGYPWTEEMVAVARKHERVVIDTSAYTVRRYPRELVAYLTADGASKVLFGSNHPMIEPARALRGLDELGLDDHTRTAFLSGNATRVFRLPAPPASPEDPA